MFIENVRSHFPIITFFLTHSPFTLPNFPHTFSCLLSRSLIISNYQLSLWQSLSLSLLSYSAPSTLSHHTFFTLLYPNWPSYSLSHPFTITPTPGLSLRPPSLTLTRSLSPSLILVTHSLSLSNLFWPSLSITYNSSTVLVSVHHTHRLNFSLILCLSVSHFFSLFLPITYLSDYSVFCVFLLVIVCLCTCVPFCIYETLFKNKIICRQNSAVDRVHLSLMIVLDSILKWDLCNQIPFNFQNCNIKY